MIHQLGSTFALLGVTPARSEAGGPDMTRYVLVCFLLLGLIGGAAYLFRRFIASNVRARASKRSLQVVDLLPLGGKQRVCVVRCYDRTFALGLGDKEVALIAELDAASAPSPKPAASFAALLRRAQTSATANEADTETSVTPARAKRGLVGSLFA